MVGCTPDYISFLRYLADFSILPDNLQVQWSSLHNIVSRFCAIITVLDGKIGSSTGQPGRGLGLSRMRRDAQSGYLQNLEIRTGKVEGDIAKMQYRKVKENFNGTY